MPDQPRPVQLPRQVAEPMRPTATYQDVLRRQDAIDGPAALRLALKLPADATDDDVLRQAAGLVATIYALRRKVYVGIIDPILRANGVDL